LRPGVRVFFSCSLLLFAFTGFGLAAERAQTNAGKRLDASSAALDEIMANSDRAIPKEVLAVAKCIAVVPSLVDVALGIGGREGKGVATCRTTNGWSAPAPFSLNGGSVGLQAGAEKVHLVMIVITQHAMNQFLSEKFKVGKDVTGEAGPVSSATSSDQGWKNSEILSYSKSHGAFKGVELHGASVKQDKKATVSLYGRYIPFGSILAGNVPAPAESEAFLTTVGKYTTKASPPGNTDSWPPAATGHR
jgi:lipid-binding SYLF domain-containing protein